MKGYQGKKSERMYLSVEASFAFYTEKEKGGWVHACIQGGSGEYLVWSVP